MKSVAASRNRSALCTAWGVCSCVVWTAGRGVDGRLALSTRRVVGYKTVGRLVGWLVDIGGQGGTHGCGHVHPQQRMHKTPACGRGVDGRLAGSTCGRFAVGWLVLLVDSRLGGWVRVGERRSGRVHTQRRALGWVSRCGILRVVDEAARAGRPPPSPFQPSIPCHSTLDPP